MKRAALAFLLVPIVCVASCARATALQGANGVLDQRILELGGGISVDSGLRLTALPPDQRYRFVSPEELARGVGSSEESSFWEPQFAEWRKEFSAVMGSGRWVESADSAHFDVTVFRTGHMKMQRVDRPQLTHTAVSFCQFALQPVPCMDDPTLFTEEWFVEYRAFYIIRRRADGAVRVWGNRQRVAPDLLDMLRSGALPQVRRVVP